MKPTQEDFVTMRELTRMTGQINQVQVHQLQMGVLVMLCAKTVELEFDPDTHVLSADITGIDSSLWGENALAEFQKRMKMYDGVVKFVLGDEYSCVIKIKGNVVGDFPPKAPPPKAHKPVFA